MPPKVCVIVNPASGRGRGLRVLPEIRVAFEKRGVHEVRTTTGPGNEHEQARRAVEEGFDTIVAAGGDGTWSNVANAIIAAGAGARVRLGLISAGTGSDFAKSVGAPSTDIAATARLALEGPDAAVDVGRIEDRHFLNVSGFGFDTAVLEDITKITWLSGPALYNYSALRQLLFYRGVDIELAAGSAPARRTHHLMLIIANARHFGGSFRIAPDARLTDGKLDAISIHDAAPLQRMMLFAAAQKGTHVRHPGVTVEQAPRFTLRFAAPPAYETDGEYHRARSATLEVSCVPRAIRIITPGSDAI